MSNYSTLKAAISAVIKENNNHEITGQVLQTTLLAMVDSLAGGYLFKGIATPATVVGTPDENVFYIGGGGVYSNFGATPVHVPDGCIGIFTYNGSFENHIIPTGGVFDISAYNAVGGTPATYANLQAALGTNGANIPDYLRKGGMSVKFIQGNAPSSDNKYVQYRYMSSSTAVADFTTVANWQGVDNEPKALSKNTIESGEVWKLCGRGIYFSKDLCDDIKKNLTNGMLQMFGQIVPHDNYRVSDYIDCEGDTVVKFSTLQYTSSTVICSIVFYNSNKDVLNYGMPLEVGSEIKQVSQIVPIPQGAKYFRICQHASFIDNSYCYTYTYDNDFLSIDINKFTNGIYDGNSDFRPPITFFEYRSSPIFKMTKGDVLYVKANQLSGRTYYILSSVNVSTLSFTPLVISKAGINEYEYMADSDIFVAICVYSDENAYVSLNRNSSRNAADAINESVKFTPSCVVKQANEALESKLNDYIGLSDGMQDFTAQIKSGFTYGLINTDGSIAEQYTNYIVTDYIPCKNKSLVRYSTFSYINAQPFCSIVFFDEQKNSLRCGNNLVLSESINQIEQVISVPKAAAYFRISQKADFIGTSYCFVYDNSSIDTTSNYRNYARGVYDGTSFRNSSNNYFVSPIIHLNRGDVVYITTTSPGNNAYNVVSSIDLQTLSISSLVSARAGTNTYEFEAANDIDVAINVFLDGSTDISIARDRNAATEIDNSVKFTPSKIVKERTDELARAISEISVNGSSYYDMYLNGGINSFDLENVVTYIGWVDNPSGKWNPRDTYSYAKFMVSPCSSVTITAQSNKPAYYALLRQYPNTEKIEGVVDFAFGQNSYGVVNAGQSVDINIPFNCYCIVLCNSTPDYTDMLPDEFIVENYGINNLPSDSIICSQEAEVRQMMAHKNTAAIFKGVLYDIFMEDDTHEIESPGYRNTVIIRLTKRASFDINNYVATTVFQASTKYRGFQTTGRVSPRHPNLVIDGNSEIIYCFASIVESGGNEYVPTSETMAFRKYHIKENRFDYDVIKCKINGNDFNITNLISAYNQISGSQVAIAGTDLNGSGKMIKASDGYYYWGIGIGTKDFGGLILKSTDLENWTPETYYPVNLAQVDRNWTWEISLEEISQGVLIAAARTEGLTACTMAKYTLSSGTWDSYTGIPFTPARPYIFKDNGEFYIIGNINGSVTTPDYGTVLRATTGIYKINSDWTLTQKGTVVVAEGCHYAEAVRVNDKIYLLYSTDSKRLNSTYAETNIGIKDVTNIFE